MDIILILLAAGDSRRFNGNKLLHPLHGKRMYEYVVDEVEAIKHLFAKRIIVTQYAEIIESQNIRGYQVIENRQSYLGISHSIRLALETIEEPGCGFCFAVCDQPYLTAGTIASLIEGFRQSKKGIACPSYHGELGNPVIFSNHYKKELLELEGDIGGKRVVKNHMDDVLLLEVGNSRELMDMDTH